MYVYLELSTYISYVPWSQGAADLIVFVGTSGEGLILQSIGRVSVDDQ